VLDLSGPAGSKARDNLHGGGLHGGAPANLHAFTSGKGYTPLSGPHKTARFDLAQSQTTLQFYLNISRGLSTNAHSTKNKTVDKEQNCREPKKREAERQHLLAIFALGHPSLHPFQAA